MSTVRSGHAMIADLFGKIVAFGGENTNVIEEYSPVTGVWTTSATALPLTAGMRVGLAKVCLLMVY